MSATPEQLTEQPPLLDGGFSYRVNREVLENVLGLSQQMISKLKAEGMPVEDHGVYDLRACIQWYIDKWRNKQTGDDNELTTRAQLNIAQKEKVELENAARRKELHPDNAVRLIIETVGMIVGSQLEAMPTRCAPLIAGLEGEQQIRDYLLEETDLLRRQISIAFGEFGENLTTDKPKKATPRKKRASKKSPA